MAPASDFDPTATVFVGGPFDGGSVWTDGHRIPDMVYTPRMPPGQGGAKPKLFPRPGMTRYERDGGRHVFRGWVAE
ncbi:hypothetical protein [Zavarzinella formosa]|uniref:hypothetical protein n=1 Tax=Zavarzinella formosa TaxID=360055 RepID=UPI000363F259|nr:hypothetical protein [Zavarzinella formosa]